MTAAGIGKAQNPELRIEQVELFAWFEANRFSGGDGDFGSGTRVAADTGFAWADIEDAEAAQLDAIAIGIHVNYIPYLHKYEGIIPLPFPNHYYVH